MSIVTKESNPELYNALFEDSTIEDAKKVMQNMFNDITPEQFEELKKQAMENVKKKNMSAKEMFDKLGYEIAYDNKYNIKYHNVKKDNYIWFMLDTKTIDIYETINIKELQAINKQIEELGWNER